MREKNNVFLAGEILGTTGIAAGAAAGIAAGVLFSKTVPRPGETSPEIINEFADAEKMKEYAEKMAPVGEWMEQQPIEEINIHARDGIRLHAYYIPAPSPSKKLVLLHHGFTSKAQDNAAHAMYFHESGYEVILLDLRAHGKSEGKYVGFGILDRFDTLEWVRYIRKRFGDDISIVMHGTSMGASTVLMALGVPEIQQSVSAVIADCAFTSPADIFSHVMKKDYHIPAPGPVIAITSLYSKAAAGYRFNDYSTLYALKNNKVPVLLIHGKEDKFVPTWMSEKNYDACSSMRKLLFVENAGHGSSVFENTELYQETERSFLNEVFDHKHQ